MYILYILVVGLIAGWATGKIMKGSGYGVLTDILLGIVGALIGSRVLGLLGIYRQRRVDSQYSRGYRGSGHPGCLGAFDKKGLGTAAESRRPNRQCESKMEHSL